MYKNPVTGKRLVFIGKKTSAAWVSSEAGGTLEFILVAVCAVLCLVARSCLTFAAPWTVARQAPLFMGFPRQE